jgi:gliding motility-associated-like protein
MSGSTKPGASYDYAIINADANGNVIAAATFDNAGKDDRARGVTELANGGFIQVGYTDDNAGNVYTLVNKVSANMVSAWSEVLTINNYSKGWGINEDVDRGVIFSGETQNGGNYDALFVKTDSMGVLSGCNYLQPVTLAATIVTPTVTDLNAVASTDSYFEYAFSGNEKIVAVGSGSTTNFCYNCAPTFVVNKNRVCLHETMYVYSKPIRCSPQSIEIADTITSQTIAPQSTNGDTTFYSFSTPGTYHITLSVQCGGVMQTIVKTLIVDPPPIASAGNDFVKCKYESVPITATGGATYQWYNQNFSTLLSSSNPFPAHDTLDATYNVVVVDTNGCIDTADVLVTVTLPHAQFSSDSACLTHPTTFHDLSTVASQTFVSWLWDYGDNSALDTAHNPTHIFPSPSIFNTTLIATTANGCKDTIKNPVLVYPLPLVDYYMVPAPVGICDGTTVNFKDTSTIAIPYSLEQWAWNFGDSTAIITSENPSHLYAAPNTYSVQLIVTSNTGCADSISHVVTINPNPVVNFTANPRVGCEPLEVTFTDSSHILAGSSNVQWLWSIGDGNPYTSTIFEHSYMNDSIFAPIYFDITLTVTSDSGCVSTLTKNNYITVYPNPVADFELEPTATTVVDPTTTVVDHSIGTDFWNWDYGDSHIDSTSKPPTHLYRPDTATYLVTLLTSTQYGCYDTAYQHIIIGPDFTFYIPNAFTPNGDGVNDYFFGSGIGIDVYDLWIFDRWGNMVFHSVDLDDKWDGKSNHGDKSSQQDVFIWKVALTDVFSEKHSYIGTVTIVR